MTIFTPNMKPTGATILNKKKVYIEVWRNPDDEAHWLGAAQGDIESMHMTSEYPLSWFRKDLWSYWYKLEGKTYEAVVCSNQCFSRDECIAIAALIISGKGLKRWGATLE